jgi:eukaryotic-like serine/threonine-protein kinase
VTPERWDEVHRLFNAAVECAPDERAALLAEACADDATLRREVEVLLAADAEAGSFINTPAAALLERLAAERSLMAEGERVGAYEVRGEIGRGGMGAVYLAVRADDLFEKRVALKLIKRGMDTDDILRRFRHERQILAALEHPHIARLYDGGTTEDGLPYFVMEYVAGEPLDAYCGSRALGLAARLRLFLDVCAAVEYAHQRLVIHCDLKPSNILVTSGGEVKLLDFGIAKLLTPEPTGAAASTAPEQRLMTPEYSSPEQLRGERVTTASDVYSLGVVLYELLTGRRPYHFTSRLPHEVLRIVCESEPESPSLAVSRQPTSEAGGERREADVRRLARALRGDLDNIVLMALRKEPERRYASVNQLAEDVRRHFEGLPVAAQKNTLGYRVRKFTARHRAGVAAALLAAASLLGGLLVATHQARAARSERARAEVERARAEQRFNDVRRLANSFLFEFHDRIKHLPGATEARQLLVRKATEYLDGLAAEAGGDASLQRELATAYQQLGEIQGGVTERANVSDSARAVESLRNALAIRERLAAAEPQNMTARRELATSYQRLGELLRDAGDIRQASELCWRAAAIREEVSAANPADVSARFELAATYRALFGLDAEERAGNMAALRKATEVCESLYATGQRGGDVRGQLVLNHLNLGENSWLDGETGQAWASLRRAHQLAEEWRAAEPLNYQARRMVFAGHLFSGNLLSRADAPDKALEHYRQSLAIAEESSTQDQKNALARRDVYLALDKLAGAYASVGRRREAVGCRRRHLAICEQLAAADPRNTRYRRDLAGGIYSLAKILATTDAPEALRQAEQALQIFEGLLKEDPNHIDIQRVAAMTLDLSARLLVKAGREEEARRRTARALSTFKAAADRLLTVGDRVNDYAALLLTCEPPDLRDPAAALPYARQAASASREKDPAILKTLALAYFLTGDRRRALDTTRKALALLPPRTPVNARSSLRRELEAQLVRFSRAATR